MLGNCGYGHLWIFKSPTPAMDNLYESYIALESQVQVVNMRHESVILRNALK